MQGQYSLRSPAVKRLMKEAQELREPTEQYHAQPLDDNLFEWHFTIRGPDDSEFKDGIYHGRIILPPDYPMKPPSIVLLTPNGRFEVFTKICLSISGHHPESWQPSWSIRTALLAIIGFMPTHGNGAIGSLDYTAEERKRLAKKSTEFKCPTCGKVADILPPITEASKADSQEAKELASQINFQGEKKKEDSTTSSTTSSPNVLTPSLPSISSPSSASQQPWPQIPGMMPNFTQFMQNMPQFPPTTCAASSQVPPFMNFNQFAAMMQQQMIQQAQSRVATGSPPGWLNTMPGNFPRMPFPATQQSQAAGPNTGVTSTSVSSTSNSSTAQSSSYSPITSNSIVTTQPTATTTTTAAVDNQTSTVGSTEGVRQRAAPTSQPSSTPRPATQPMARPRPAEVRRPATARSTSTLTWIVMVILALAILALVLRRLHMMGFINFDQDIFFDE